MDRSASNGRIRPYGGIGTHEWIIAAIRQIGFEPCSIPVAQIQERPDSFSCNWGDGWRGQLQVRKVREQELRAKQEKFPLRDLSRRGNAY
jgi:hypothetical protein